MKSIHLPRILAGIAAFVVIGWTGTAFANDHHRHDAWSRDHNGYWDDHNTHHAFAMHNHHQGYWRTQGNGSRIFININ